MLIGEGVVPLVALVIAEKAEVRRCGGPRHVLAGHADTAFLCAAGGPHSYMSVMGMANSMMLDFRTIVVPRFVYATGKAVTDGVLTDPDVDRRVGELAVDWRRMTEALRGPR